MVLLELPLKKLQETYLLLHLITPINTQSNFTLIAIVAPSLQTQNHLRKIKVGMVSGNQSCYIFQSSSLNSVTVWVSFFYFKYVISFKWYI